MSTISIDRADKEFGGVLQVGQYVAWWIADDGQGFMPMTGDSHVTEQGALDEARAEGEKHGTEGGRYVAALLVHDDDEDSDDTAIGHEKVVSAGRQ